MFALVEFLDHSVATVPTGWIQQDLCYWPNLKEVTKTVKMEQSPDENWKQHKVYIKAIYDSYEEAKKAEKKYENSSNLESTDNENLGKGHRGRKRPYDKQESPEDEMDPSQSQSLLKFPPNENLGKGLKRPCDNTQDSSEDEIGPSQSQSILKFPPVPNQNQKKNQPPVLDTPQCSFTLTTEPVSSVPHNYEVLAVGRQVSSDHSETRSDGMLSQVLKAVLHNKFVLKEQGDMLSTIISSLNCIYDRLPTVNNAQNYVTTTLPVNLPLTTSDDLAILEEALDAEDLKEYLCEKLSQIGGSNLGNAVRRMLTKLLTNELAKCYSWVGIKGKEPFASLKITSVLISAVRRNASFINSTNNDIETVIKDWLRHAKARCKN